MGGSLRDRSGGIVGLLTLPREQWQAIEADLLDRGYVYEDIGSRITWRAVNAMVKHCRRGSALFAVVFGEAGEWGPLEHMNALLVDLTQLLLWIQTEDGHEGKNRPTPMRRPGHEAPEDASADRLGSKQDSIPMDEWDEWWSAAPAMEEAISDGE